MLKKHQVIASQRPTIHQCTIAEALFKPSDTKFWIWSYHRLSENHYLMTNGPPTIQANLISGHCCVFH